MKTYYLLALHRAMCTSQCAINLWFPQYKRWLRYQQVTHGDYIWNIDECPLPDLQGEGDDLVVGLKGIPAMQIVGGEKPENSTLVTYVSGSGRVVTPMLILKGQRTQT